MGQSKIKKMIGNKGIKLAQWMKETTRSKKIKIHLDEISFRVDSTNHFWFWQEFQTGDWEPKTIKILNSFLDKKNSFIDLGAWIGPTTLYASNLSKHCYAIEPDPMAFSELQKNISLNKNLESKITLFDICISDHSGTTNLFCPSTSKFGNSNSSILKRGENSIEVKSLTMNDFLNMNQINDCNFIKIDIEGGEFIVLPTMIDYLQEQKPTLLIELHSPFVENLDKKFKDLIPLFEIYKNIYNYDLKKFQ